MTRHQSVLLHETLSLLAIGAKETVVDATLGGGGHAQAIAERLGPDGVLIGFDLDADALLRTRDRLAGFPCRTILIEDNFRHIVPALAQRHFARIDKALFDLGWSSDQLDAGRGFSFHKNEPLTMTYRTLTDSRRLAADAPAHAAMAPLTAREIINEWSETSLSDILFGWGEERYARRIARAIVRERASHPIESSSELADLVRRAVPPAYARGRIHPATRTFQALRIAVNDELGALEGGLAGAWQLLKPGGRIAVITFHSIEDRHVKRRFAELAKRGEGRLLSKKPIVPTEEETSANPRAKSAKLRAIEKIQTSIHT